MKNILLLISIVLIQKMCFAQLFNENNSPQITNIDSVTLDKINSKISNLEKTINSEVKLEESPVKFTIGGNFSDLEKIAFRSYYARISFYKDGMKLPPRLNCNLLDFGLYSGIFKQSYLNTVDNPNSIFSKSNITAINKDSFYVEKKYFSLDTTFTTSDQIGFFISPNVLVYKYKFDHKRKSEHYATIRANFDIEYLKNNIKIKNISSPLDTINETYSITELDNFDSTISRANDITSSSNTVKLSQRYIGAGISFFYKMKVLEFLYKCSIGKVSYFDISQDRPKVNYAINYFCVSHIPTGLRIGGEIRRTSSKHFDKNYFNYNLFIAYCIDFKSIAALYPKK